jgi:hypothetical protein
MRSCPGFLRAFPWIFDPVKDRSGMTEKIDYDNRFAEHEHKHGTPIRHACEGRHPGFYPKTLLAFKLN